MRSAVTVSGAFVKHTEENHSYAHTQIPTFVVFCWEFVFFHKGITPTLQEIKHPARK